MSDFSKAISRRQLLKASAAVGGSMMAQPLLLNGAAFAEQSPLAAKSGETVYFRGWQFQTDIVQANVDRYNKELGGKVDYQTVTGDYPSLMEKDLIAKANLDVFYANPSQAVRYLEGGWVLPAGELPNFQEIADDMYPNIREAWTYKGKLLGICYFVSARGIMAVNLDKYLPYGFEEGDLPKTWPELYAQLYKLRDKGVTQPYLPHWFNEWYGISWGFVFEVMNRGGTLADAETHKPMMSADSAAGDTLRDWQKLWKDGFVSEELLSYSDAAFTDAFRSGRFTFSARDSYDLADYNRKDKSPAIAGKVVPVPFKGQSWGLHETAMYVMANRTRPPEVTEDVKRFVSWYGYKDQDGKVFVGSRWLKENMLFSAYKSVMESPETAEIMRSSLARPTDYEVLIDLYKNASYPKGVWNVVWAEEFNSWIKDKLFAFLLNGLKVEDVINEANDKIVSLNKKYKID